MPSRALAMPSGALAVPSGALMAAPWHSCGTSGTTKALSTVGQGLRSGLSARRAKRCSDLGGLCRHRHAGDVLHLRHPDRARDSGAVVGAVAPGGLVQVLLVVVLGVEELAGLRGR